MPESLTHWIEVAGARGVRIVAIFVIAFLVSRLLKILTDRLIQLAKSQSRVAQMREQQTRTMAALLYSVGSAVIFAGAVLTALPEFGFDVTPVEA
ncbi:MAG: hypothetical protein WBX12_01955, partial [Candidatus Acidiferrales bacterium]